MAILSLALIPGLSPAPTVQRYTYTAGSETVGAIIGTAVTGVVDGTYTSRWNFDVTAWAVGDYWVQVSGVSTPNARPVPVRINVLGAHYEPSWEIMNVAHAAAITYPSAISGKCHLLFSVVDNAGNAALKATVSAIVDAGSTYNGGMVSTTATTAQTDSGGNAILTLIQDQTFTAGGIYTLKVTDRSGKLISERRVRMANTTEAIAEDLVAA